MFPAGQLHCSTTAYDIRDMRARSASFVNSWDMALESINQDGKQYPNHKHKSKISFVKSFVKPWDLVLQSNNQNAENLLLGDITPILR